MGGWAGLVLRVGGGGFRVGLGFRRVLVWFRVGLGFGRVLVLFRVREGSRWALGFRRVLAGFRHWVVGFRTGLQLRVVGLGTWKEGNCRRSRLGQVGT